MRLRCDRCDTKYRVPEAYQGRKVVCTKCGKVMRVGEDISMWLKTLSSVMQEWGRYDEAQEHADALHAAEDDEVAERRGPLPAGH